MNLDLRIGKAGSATAGRCLNGFTQPVGATGMPNTGMNNGFSVGQNMSPGFDDRCLQLTFESQRRADRLVEELLGQFHVPSEKCR